VEPLRGILLPIAASADDPEFMRCAERVERLRAYLISVQNITSRQSGAAIADHGLLGSQQIAAPLWSATQFSTLLVLAFRNLTISPLANMTVAGETVLIVEIDYPVVIISGRTGAVILMSVMPVSVAGKVSIQQIPVGWARCPSNMVRPLILMDPALCSRTFSNRIPATAASKTFVPAITIPIKRSSNLQRSSNRRNIRSSNRNRSSHRQLYRQLYLHFNFKESEIMSNDPVAAAAAAAAAAVPAAGAATEAAAAAAALDGAAAAAADPAAAAAAIGRIGRGRSLRECVLSELVFMLAEGAKVR
jgi:hypothetical protein